jgi:hypothetical protein
MHATNGLDADWLSEVEIECLLPGIIKGDNSGAITLTKNTKDYGKNKAH